METKIHDGLIGKRVTLYVSDPWDFATQNGVGPFGGTIRQIREKLLTVSLDREISFSGETFGGLVVGFRTQNGPADLRAAIGASANFVPISDATSSTAFTEVAQRRRWGLMGSIAVAEG